MSAAPAFPEPSGELDIPGLAIGHGTDPEGKTGITVILCPAGAVAAADVRGTATGTRQFDSVVAGHHLATQIHGVVLAGGSGFGLSSSAAVVEHLERGGHGFRTGFRQVPVVPTAILFDLGFGSPDVAPDRVLAERALAAAGAGEVPCGSVGAGTGATVGKCAGHERAMKGGFGFASLRPAGGPTVAAAAAVNPYGDVRDPETGRLVAGCRAAPDSSELADSARLLAALDPSQPHPWEGNTTLVVVMTDAILEKAEARKVSEMAFGGLYRTISPALSLYDGDLVLTLATGERRAHVHQVGVLAERAVVAAILKAVRAADGFGILPAVRDLKGAP